MPKFLCIHSLKPGSFSSEDLSQFSRAAQQDPVIHGYRSFANLSEGKAVCIIEAPDERALSGWFRKVGMPFDSITELEYEGEKGEIKKAA